MNHLATTLVGCSALALRVHSDSQTRRQAGDPNGPPQPTSSERQNANAHLAHFRCLWPVFAPRLIIGSLDRRAIMRTVYTPPGESSGHIISSIINLVCPQCGGRMSPFQCEGRCRRNWLAEWEWAHRSAGSSRSRLPRHAGRSRR